MRPAFEVLEGVFVLRMEEYMSLFWPNHPTLSDLFISVKEALAREELEQEVKQSLGANEFGYSEVT